MEEQPGVGDAPDDGPVEGPVDGPVGPVDGPVDGSVGGPDGGWVDAVAVGSAAAREGLGGVLAAPLWRLPDARVREATGEVFGVLQAAQAGYLRLVGELDTRPGAVPGAGSGQTARSFLVGRLHRSTGQAWADVRAAAAVRTAGAAGAAIGDAETDSADADAGAAGPGGDPLDGPRGLPGLGVALAEGRVSREHLDVAVKAVRRIPTHLLTAEDPDGVPGRARVEEYLLASSSQFSPAQVERLVKHLLAVLDPEGRDRFDPDAETRRELTLMLDSTGMVGVRGWLTAIPGAMLTALIEHYSAPHPPREEVADDGTVVQVLDTRTGAQRRADALTRIITDAADHNGLHPSTQTADQPGDQASDQPAAEPGGRRRAGELTRGGERPRITVQATIEQIREAFDRAQHPTSSSLPGSSGSSGVGLAGAAECEQTGPITARVLGQLMCDAVLERVLLGPSGAVVNLGRGVRTATAAQKRALAARDGGCIIPGCTAPWQHCDVHHVTWWSRGGRTDIDDLVLACPHDHTQIHHGRLEIRMIHGVPWTRLPAWIDHQRRWTRNTYWTHARPHARDLGQQLRLTSEAGPTAIQKRPETPETPEGLHTSNRSEPPDRSQPPDGSQPPDRNQSPDRSENAGERPGDAIQPAGDDP